MENKTEDDGGVADPPADMDADADDSDFVEVDPTGRYGRYDEILGKGAFKTVYRAFDEVDGIEVAWNQVKVQDVLQSPEDLERLYSEVHLLKTLKHKNIIKFYNSWVDTKTKNVNFITEIFTSGTLRQYRKRHKHVDIKAVKNWSRQILRGLLYLHSHDPPIIHRDLKCDNIFVNGNQGEVKIGDLGLAAILRQAHAAHSVIGTPEFMAPELYEEEYNELVDIYSFGMCLLEMVTFEYPYSECTNAAQIYKKVTSGKKPAALEKIKDPEVKAFVQKCLATASRRLPARELLMDPFLLCEGDREAIDCLPPLSRSRSGVDDMDELGITGEDSSFRMGSNSSWKERRPDSEVQGKGKGLATSEKHDNGSSNSAAGPVGDSEGEDDAHLGRGHSGTHKTGKEERPRRSRDFRVKGKRRDDDTIFLRLRIADPEGHIRNIHFPFDVEADTAMSVATEMLEELDLSDQDVTTIAEMIDAEILALVPEWKPGVACDETVGAEAEPSYDSRRDSPLNADGYPRARNDFDPLATISSEGSLLDKLPLHRKMRSHSPRLGALMVGSPPRVEGTMHGRFEEITYHPRGSDQSWRNSDASPVFSSDLSDAQEGASDVGGEHNSPESSTAELPWHMTRFHGGGDVDQIREPCGNTSGAAEPAHRVEGSSFNELVESRRNAGYGKYTHQTWEAVAVGSRLSEVDGHAEPHEEQERTSQSVEGHSASQSDDGDAVIADREFRLLAQRQEEEMRAMQWRHQQALLSLKARIHRKEGSSEDFRTLRDSFRSSSSESPERISRHMVGQRASSEPNRKSGINGFRPVDMGSPSPSEPRGVYKVRNGQVSVDESEESDRLSMKELAVAFAEANAGSREGTASQLVGSGIVH